MTDSHIILALHAKRAEIRGHIHDLGIILGSREQDVDVQVDVVPRA
ncbi:MAG TPA: hypothetical protein VIH87_12305 [Methylocella sp.]